LNTPKKIIPNLSFLLLAPQVYAVIGAASAVGGLTRMTVSLVVIIFELTGAVELVLQIMMAVMISKFTADYFSTDGIYEGQSFFLFF
jgi:chloride channel 3/4/5